MGINKIFQDSVSGNVTIRGPRFTRLGSLQGLFTDYTDEVCQVIQVDLNDDRAPVIQGMEDADTTEIVKHRRIILTNLPLHSASAENLRTAATAGEPHLMCRWRYTRRYENARARKKEDVHEHELARLRYEDSHRDFRVQDEILRANFRGETVRGGMYTRCTPSWSVFPPILLKPPPSSSQTSQYRSIPSSPWRNPNHQGRHETVNSPSLELYGRIRSANNTPPPRRHTRLPLRRMRSLPPSRLARTLQTRSDPMD